MAIKKGWRNKQHQTDVVAHLTGYKGDVIAFDVETTGLSAMTDRVIELAAIRYELTADNFLHKKDVLHQYINPGFALSEKIIDLTGITDEKLAHEPSEENCFDKIKAFFGEGPVILAAHNARFDVGFLTAMYERHNAKMPSITFVVDTLELARDIIPSCEVPNYKLGTLAEYVGIADGVQFHSAIEDIQVTAKLLQCLYLEAIAEEQSQETTPKIRPTVRSVRWWEGYQGFSRIYVSTTAGDIYYDVRRSTWFSKDAILENLDLSYIESVCLSMTQCQNIEQFKRFTGRVN